MEEMNRDIDRAHGLYLITDGRSARSGPAALLGAMEKALEGGVRFVQLREKELPAKEFLRLARALRELTASFGARLIVNDRVDVAILSDADGVHLGGRSVSATDARILLGPEKLIGVSTHSYEEALDAREDGADFITLGPVFATPSKAAWGDPVGVGLLEKVAASLSIPVYAIGGINPERVKHVLAAGASGVAVISAVLGRSDVKEGAHEMVSALIGLESDTPV